MDLCSREKERKLAELLTIRGRVNSISYWPATRGEVHVKLRLPSLSILLTSSHNIK